MKALRPSRTDEIKVLKYLQSFKSSENHSPADAIFHHLNRGALLFTRYLGVPVLEYRHLSQHLLPIIRQFLEGVAFMHSKFVAHMDLKSSHIIIDENAKVWIVDYDLSEIFDGADHTVSGFRGTRGWTAPEVGRRTYDPFLADVWATGKVIQELCADNVEHQDFEFLQTISTKLMKRNPKRRATIQEVLRMLFNQHN